MQLVSSRVLQRALQKSCWSFLKALLFVKKTSDYGLKFYESKDKKLITYVDASWHDAENKRSTRGYVTFNGPNILAFKTKVQRVVARSTSEAEFIGIGEAAKEILFAKHVLEFVSGKKMTQLPMIINDNRGAVLMCQDLASIRRVRHLELAYFHINDLVEKNEDTFIK